MAVGFAASVANGWLDGLPTLWVQLHTGDPGAAGTSNVAGNDTRKQVTRSAASGGASANTVALAWSTGEVDTAEDYTHLSLWTASTAGTFQGSGLMTANAVLVGDTFTIPIGDLDLTLIVAS